MLEYRITSDDLLTGEHHVLSVEAHDKKEAIQKALDLLKIAGVTGQQLLTVTRVEFVTTIVKEVK